MSEYVPVSLRRVVRERAEYRCEYCMIGEDDSLLPHEPDHIIAVKHAGHTDETNLAWACFSCNRRKGTDVASVDPLTNNIVRLFHPRRDDHQEHFELEPTGRFEPATDVGRTTVFLLCLNDDDRVLIRQRLVIGKRFPR